MKILIVQDYLRNGGTERQSVLLSQAFAAAGHSTTLLTFRPGGKLAPVSASPPAQFLHRSLQPFDFHLDWFAPRLLRTAAKLEPEIVLCMGRMANGYAGGLQSRLPGAALVAT